LGFGVWGLGFGVWGLGSALHLLQTRFHYLFELGMKGEAEHVIGLRLGERGDEKERRRRRMEMMRE